MSQLHNIQAAFIHDIYHNDQTSSVFLDQSQYNSLARLAIYRNNLQLNLHENLQSTYPVTEQLLGSAFFKQSTQQYIANYPLQQGNLSQFGHAFSAFLSTRATLNNMAYIAEIAELEWAYFQATIANNSLPLDFERLNLDIRHSDYVLTPHPATRCVYNRYNSVEIWQQHQRNETDNLTLHEADQHWLIWRDQHHEVLLKRIPKSLVYLIENSRNGKPFSDIMRSYDEQTNLDTLQHSFSNAVSYGAFAV